MNDDIIKGRYRQREYIYSTIQVAQETWRIDYFRFLAFLEPLCKECVSATDRSEVFLTDGGSWCTRCTRIRLGRCWRTGGYWSGNGGTHGDCFLNSSSHGSILGSDCLRGGGCRALSDLDSRKEAFRDAIFNLYIRGYQKEL